MIDLQYAMLDADKNIVLTSSVELSLKHRLVKHERFKGRLVSTVLLPINHGFGGKSLWFETMVFGITKHLDDTWQERCETYEEALKMHKRAKNAIMHGETRA